MCEHVTNKGGTNYMERIEVAKLHVRETETAKPILARTDLAPFNKPSLLTDSS